jgi:nitroimidazol reductase NimA-like FMN-containing flavoprotein (pyridoxamine 5'-phosphate oxidase superfamily)
MCPMTSAAACEVIQRQKERTRVRRQPTRGVYDRDTIYRIVDEALIGHVGFVTAGSPYVIPMVVVRNNDDLLLHGWTASRLMRHLATGAEVCVCVTHLDGVVVARSVFDNSMNYRSVVVFGRARPLTDAREKTGATNDRRERAAGTMGGSASPQRQGSARHDDPVAAPERRGGEGSGGDLRRTMKQTSSYRSGPARSHCVWWLWNQRQIHLLATIS